jgi:hypothetical protein
MVTRQNHQIGLLPYRAAYLGSYPRHALLRAAGSHFDEQKQTAVTSLPAATKSAAINRTPEPSVILSNLDNLRLGRSQSTRPV